MASNKKAQELDAQLTQVTNTKVAIVGFAPSWNLAPFDNKEFDVWGINELYVLAQGKRFTTWFEIHNPESPSKKTEKHQNWLANAKIPIAMQKHYDKFPTSFEYPRNDVKAMISDCFIINDIGSPYTDYSNQITWMVLYAIHKGYKEIHLYGVDMAQQSEYAWQRASCQFAIGFAAGRGIKILIPKTSELCKYPRDYGFETDNANRFLAKDRVTSLQQTVMGYQQQIYDLQGQYQIKHSEFKRFKENTEDNLIKIGDDMIKYDITLNKNKEMANFLQTMPNDVEQINNKKLEILSQILNQNKVIEEGITNLEKQAKEIKKKLDAEIKIDYINKQFLKTGIKNLEKQIHSASGAMGECNYNLSNNRV